MGDGEAQQEQKMEMPTLKMRRLREWCRVQGPNGLQLGSNSWCLGVSVGLHTCIGLRRGQITAGLQNIHLSFLLSLPLME